MRSRLPAMIGLAAAAMLAAMAARAANPDALWNIVSKSCVPHEQDGSGGKPCAFVDLSDGYAVLKDLVGATQFLMIPTERVGGIESPAVLAPDAPDYWADAWAARRFVIERAGRPLGRDDIGLAINSVSGRSQNQLHIHIDCMRPDVRQALRDDAGAIGQTWAPLPMTFSSHTYLARRLDQPELTGVNPFRLLAAGVPAAGADMAHETLVVTGAVSPQGRDGFILLADHADLAAGDFGSGEELLDHSCALAHPAQG